MSARARDLPAHPCPRTCDHRVLSDAGGVEHEAGEGDVDPRVEAHVAIARLHVRDRVHDGATHLDERVRRDLVHILDANVDLAVASNGTSRSITSITRIGTNTSLSTCLFQGCTIEANILVT